MQQKYFNNIVKRLLKNKNKIITSEKIKNLVSNILEDEFTPKKSYKILYHLKNKGYLIPLKKDIFFVKLPSQETTQEEIIDKFYRDILRNHCREKLDYAWYVWWLKACQLNAWDFSVPEEIEIINPHKQARETILTWKYWNFRKYTGKDINIFNKLKKLTNKTKIWKYTISFSNLELSILESLYNIDDITWNFNIEFIKRIIRKYKKKLNYENFDYITKLGKHQTSINRLYKISKSIDPNISENIKKIIKKNSYFLDL